MENGDPSESSFPEKAYGDRFRLPVGCRMPVGYLGWLTEGWANIITFIYSYLHRICLWESISFYG
jgi:hypothetical protein